MAWDASPGHRLPAVGGRRRLAQHGGPAATADTDPRPVRVDPGAAGGRRVRDGDRAAAAPAPAGDDPGAGVTWRIERDVLGRRTSCADEHGSEYEVDGGQVRERYSGRVEVATGTFAQRAEASADFTVTWPEAAVRARADLVVEAGPTSYDVDLTVETWQDGEPFGSRRWTRSIPRDLG